MKTIGDLGGRLETKRNQQAGFNLLELIVAMLIIGIVSSFSIPVFQRSMVQGQMDRYMQNLESGLFFLNGCIITRVGHGGLGGWDGLMWLGEMG